MLDGDPAFHPPFLKSLIKIAHLSEELSDLPIAFQSIQNAIEHGEQLLENDPAQWEKAFGAILMMRGQLYEKISMSEKALADYDRCLTLYEESTLAQNLDNPSQLFLHKNEVAHMTMCRANMLADLSRYEESAKAFETAAGIYSEALLLASGNEKDEGVVRYSISILQLNHANMLIAQNKYEEAIAIHEQAIETLLDHYRKEPEVLPNVHTAHRKIINLFLSLNKHDEALQWMERHKILLEKNVDEGHLEYQMDLASLLYREAASLSKLDQSEKAQKLFLRALGLFRLLADEDETNRAAHTAKMHWAETLDRLAREFARHGHFSDAFDLFQNTIETILKRFSESPRQFIFDLILAYSYYLTLLSDILNDADTTISPAARQGGLELAVKESQKSLEYATHYLETLTEDDAIRALLRTKIASFFFLRGSFLSLAKKWPEAELAYSSAAQHWESLRNELEQKRFEQEYYEREARAQQQAGERAGMTVIEVPGALPPELFFERLSFFSNELRQTYQHWTEVLLQRERPLEACAVFEKELALSRKMATHKAYQPHRFLVVSLLNFTRNMESHLSAGKTQELFEEARDWICERFKATDLADDDFVLCKFAHLDFALFLKRKGEEQAALSILSQFATLLENCVIFPSCTVWIFACRTWDDPQLLEHGIEIEGAKTLQLRLLERHPDFVHDQELQEYGQSLQSSEKIE